MSRIFREGDVAFVSEIDESGKMGIEFIKVEENYDFKDELDRLHKEIKVIESLRDSIFRY